MPVHECLVFQTRTYKQENPVCEGGAYCKSCILVTVSMPVKEDEYRRINTVNKQINLKIKLFGLLYIIFSLSGASKKTHRK